jgi:enediyne biosynthesis protein E4
LTFGLAMHNQADSIEIRWPSGQVEKHSNVAAGQTITVTEGKGITGSRKYGAR